MVKLIVSTIECRIVEVGVGVIGAPNPTRLPNDIPATYYTDIEWPFRQAKIEEIADRVGPCTIEYDFACKSRLPGILGKVGDTVAVTVQAISKEDQPK